VRMGASTVMNYRGRSVRLNTPAQIGAPERQTIRQSGDRFLVDAGLRAVRVVIYATLSCQKFWPVRIQNLRYQSRLKASA